MYCIIFSGNDYILYSKMALPGEKILIPTVAKQLVLKPVKVGSVLNAVSNHPFLCSEKRKSDGDRIMFFFF